jgi:hypothetical protein
MRFKWKRLTWKNRREGFLDAPSLLDIVSVFANGAASRTERDQVYSFEMDPSLVTLSPVFVTVVRVVMC